MRRRGWFWAATCADIFLLAFGIYMAVAAAEIAARTSGAPLPVAITLVFAALPVFCLAAPFAAWRAQRRRGRPGQVIALFAAPWVYALFLMVFLFNS